MKHAVREDPDVMLVGEMRDRETFETAIQAAETGHLVFGTIHASTAPSTIGRILDLFPRELHTALRSAMVFNMKADVENGRSLEAAYLLEILYSWLVKHILGEDKKYEPYLPNAPAHLTTALTED